MVLDTPQFSTESLTSWETSHPQGNLDSWSFLKGGRGGEGERSIETERDREIEIHRETHTHTQRYPEKHTHSEE